MGQRTNRLLLASALSAVGFVASSSLSLATGATSLAAPAEECADGHSHADAPGGGSWFGGDGGEMSEAEVAAAESATDARLAIMPRETAGATNAVQIKVRFHLFHDVDNNHAWVTRAQVEDQITRMNRTFNGAFGGANTRFSFVLDSMERIGLQNAVVEDFSDRADNLARNNRSGGKQVLNIWSADITNAGYATYPWDQPSAPDLDGVWLDFGSFPGVSAGGRDGDSGPHEAGHWLGLYHTHQGGCTGNDGDRVGDTPRSNLDEFFDCSPGQSFDSCPGQPGNDKVDNIMSYAHDACRDQFTPGQSSRMSKKWNAWRG